VTTTAFLTGSHAYGTPRKGSDIDVVVRMDEDQAVALAGHLSTELRETHYPRASVRLKHGQLDIIAVCNDEEFEAWRRITDFLVSIAPVTRDQAVKAFRSGLPSFQRKDK
jgi:predicted nucleotidyltransferase